MTTVWRTRILVGLACAVLMACSPKATSKPAVQGPARVGAEGVVPLLPPAAALSPDGCAVSILMDHFGYERAGGVSPKPATRREMAWRLKFVQPVAPHSKAHLTVRGAFIAPPEAKLTLTGAFGDAKVASARAGAGLTDAADQGVLLDADLAITPGATSAVLRLSVEVTEPAEAKANQTLLQIDSADLGFASCGK